MVPTLSRALAIVCLLSVLVGLCHGYTLNREKRQTGSMMMNTDGGSGSDRAAIPGLGELQTVIDVAQFLLNVGQQVLPGLLEQLPGAITSVAGAGGMGSG
ncbi:uncharacterized protein LOC129739353 [Uranotaenia lowii]|uniref:uncharacterized protein LOC129739353 n=1 Tax=Uranotaenia lowii TaxID=190385 RepID=UPI00247973E5|nr:uncharacterized protein LOC129739353 [Uranotaenia lowii]